MNSVTRAYALHREGGERLRWGEVEILVKASGAATDGAFALFEEIAPVDTPLHVHEREDELFFVLEGEHVFEVGEDEFRVGPGGLVFAPRGVPHAQRRVVPRTGRVLVFTVPAGLEGFFRALADADRAGTLGPEAYAGASEQHGITWLTPADARVPARPLDTGTRQRVPADTQTTIGETTCSSA
jgi:mannose-6-phosphate isomerase-like protein (cupin superfamily)